MGIDLHKYQKDACGVLFRSIESVGAALDASDTGTGKTFTALGVAREVRVPPLIICPKSVKSAWRQVAADLEVPVLDVVNIEKLKAGNTPHLKKVSKGKFVWMLPRGSFVIYDEVHSASGYRTDNATVLAIMKAHGFKVLMLSATAADSPLKLMAIGYLLGLHKYRDHYSWCRKYGCYPDRWGGLAFTKGAYRINYLKEIHEQIFPDRGVRVRIKDLPDFPDNSIFADAYDLDEYTEAINKIYDEMDEEIQDPDSSATELVARLRARQQTELFKVPLMVDMAKEAREEGKSVVIFISFRDTLAAFELALGDCSIIVGGQKEAVRDENIRRFQANETFFCLSMIQAGGVGLSLHDVHGGHPRLTLMTPVDSARELKQALGRTPRDGGKSKCIQKIIFAAGTVEAEICRNVRGKLDNISALNDGDLQTGINYGKDD